MTDGPDDILRGLTEGDSEGPEASAEQEAFVSGLLGSLRRDDPPMPDDVIRRLSGVLAEERREGAPVLGVIAGGGSDPDSPATLPDNVSVLPTAAERRGPSSRSFRLLGGLAAAAVLVVGAATVLGGGLGGGVGTDTAGGAPEAASIVQDSGTAYSADSLPDQAQSLVARAQPRAVDSAGGPGTPAPAPSGESTSTDSTGEPVVTETAATGPVTTERALLCTRELSAGTVAEPLLVDQGTYNGRDAEVYVLASVDAPGAFDVYVVVAGCTTGLSELLDFRRVTTP